MIQSIDVTGLEPDQSIPAPPPPAKNWLVDKVERAFFAVRHFFVSLWILLKAAPYLPIFIYNKYLKPTTNQAPSEVNPSNEQPSLRPTSPSMERL